MMRVRWDMWVNTDIEEGGFQSCAALWLARASSRRMNSYMSTMILGAWRMRKVTTMLRRIRNKFSSFFSLFFEPNL